MGIRNGERIGTCTPYPAKEIEFGGCSTVRSMVWYSVGEGKKRGNGNHEVVSVSQWLHSSGPSATRLL